MRLQGQLNGNEKIDPDKILGILSDRSLPPDDELPDTGVGLEWERILSPLFITSDVYGTRSSSVVLIDRSGKIRFIERSYLKDGSKIVESGTKNFCFTISE